MGSFRSGKPLAAAGAAAIAAAGLLTGGIAIASDSGAADVIHACASRRTGALRVAAHCRSGEAALAWNQHGAPGLNGGRGPAGPSDAYIAYSPVTFLTDLGPTSAQVGPTLDLPTPMNAVTSYVVSAEVLMGATSTNGMVTECTLSIGGATTFPEVDANFLSFAVGPLNGVMPLTASGDLPGTVSGVTTAQVECSASPIGGIGSGTVQVSNVRLTGIKVGSLNVSAEG